MNAGTYTPSQLETATFQNLNDKQKATIKMVVNTLGYDEALLFYRKQMGLNTKEAFQAALTVVNVGCYLIQ